MSGNRTFMMIKPLAVKQGFIGPILAKLNEGGFKFIALKLTQMTLETAKQFYAVHDGKPFFNDLAASMSSGPIIVAIIEKEDAVLAYRNFIGATNPAVAAEGSIRKLYGTDFTNNAVHGSDSDENAAIEGNFFFSTTERY